MEIEWPAEDGLYKVVQVEIDGREHLGISSIESTVSKPNPVYHAGLLAELLRKADVPFKSNDNRSGRSMPEESGERYKLSGSGFVRINHADKIPNFAGQSHDYKIGINLSSLMKLETDWNIQYQGCPLSTFGKF